MNLLAIEQLDQASTGLPSNFLDRLSDLAFVCSRDGNQLIAINPQVTDFVGWTHQELQGLDPWWKHLFNESSHEAFEGVLELIDFPASHQDHPAVNLEAINLGGSSVPIRLHSIFYDSTSLTLLATSQVVSNNAGEILRQTQARFRSIVDSLSINLVLKDLHGRRIYANRSYLDLRGVVAGDVLGKLDQDLFPPDLARQYAEDDRQVLESGKIIHKFEENVDHQGQRTWTEVIKGPLRDADQRIMGVQILFWDATKRRATELALERERYLLRALLNNIPDSIYFKDRDSRFVRISRGMAEKFQLEDPKVAIGKTDADIFTAEHAAQARDDELQIMATGKPMVARIERETWPDKPDTWCSTTKMPLRDADGNIVGTFGISRDMTQQIEAEQMLREARDVADQANRAKSEFLAKMSHEIRTPMNGITGMAELLRNTQLTSAQRSFLDMIDQSAHSLLRIINDILDFSKIEAGKLDLEKTPFDLRRCVSHAAKSLAARAAQKSVELILQLSPDLPDQVVGDAGRVRQVLVNLVGNAIKFTQNGEITIRVSVADGPPTADYYMLHFSVRDTGIGIPREKQKLIFEAFSQADVSTTRQYGGTGLGLSISAQLVDLMEGRIWLESEPNVGSTFHFTAKFAPVSAATASVGKATEESIPLDEISLRGLPVLIMQSNAASRSVLENSLTRRGLQTLAVGTDDESVARGIDFLQQNTRKNHESPVAKQDDIETRSERGESIHAWHRRAEPLLSGRGVVILDMARGIDETLPVLQRLADAKLPQSPITILLAATPQPGFDQAEANFRIDAMLQKPALQSEICLAIRRAVARELGDSEPDQAQISVTGGSSESAASFSNSTSTSDPHHASAQAAPTERSLKILLAEDGEVNRLVFFGLLQNRGHEVFCVEDGQAAVDAWEQANFDAIFMDLQMPVLDGIEATRVIRQQEAKRGGHIPIIAITAAAMEADHTRCLQAGMDDYLSKPIDFNELDRLLRDIASTEGPLSGTTRSASNHSNSATDKGRTQWGQSKPIASNATDNGAGLSGSPRNATSPADNRRSSEVAIEINFEAPLSKLRCTQQQQQQMVATLHRETQQRLEELSRAIDIEDLKLMVRASHSLRSATALFEAHEVAEKAGILESSAREGDLSRANHLFAELRQPTLRMLAAIDSWLETKRAGEPNEPKNS
jgi:two-component system, sensor histidine kinase and response regulator